MQRRNKLLEGTAALLTILVGTAALLMWARRTPAPSVLRDATTTRSPSATPPEHRLLGTWEGTGNFSGDWSIDFHPDPEHGKPGGKASGKMTSASTVQAEFRPDGSYSWNEHYEGGGFNMNILLPKDAASVARWEFVSAQGNKVTIRIHLGDTVCDFHDENAFTMSLPESTQSRGTYVFRRSSVPTK